MKADYAIGAFNVNNMEIIRASPKLPRSAMLLSSFRFPRVRALANRTYLVKAGRGSCHRNRSAHHRLHLDHGDSYETCKSCIDDGFTSVMIDCSSLPFEENIRITRQVVEYAHERGVVVEAELGTLAGVEDEVSVSAEASSYTRPEDVQGFVERTGCDSPGNCYRYFPWCLQVHACSVHPQ